ncbi:MAG: glycoside hydrolase family 3 C-terminal domain-containing protein [Erysipelotrichaceae bacterium]|nr:glycoside hydrolase family 3 C-terminal domain-containing protein [Erysipelotrichaceae bacterium]
MEQHKRIIDQMTNEEKASLGSGADFWHTQPIPTVGIPSIMMTDGPHGLRKQKDQGDHIGINQSYPATCFPTAATLANSWDKELIKQMGEALANECHSQHVSLLLGPGINIKRSPLCGRNFEYFSEDPYLVGELANSLVCSIESSGIGTSLKHFAVNNQEYNRMVSDSIVDPRALREIYLSAFEKVVKQAKPATVMAAYNKVNGTYCCENEFLLNEVLRKEWGYEGVVVSDWGATNDRIKSHVAGMDLQMPGITKEDDRKVADALASGLLNPKVIDASVSRVLHLTDSYPTSGNSIDEEMHHQLARKIASESFVLLKNDGLLPLTLNENILIIGNMAKHPRYQGSGSSLISPTKLPSLIDVFDNRLIAYTYSEGIGSGDMADEKLLQEAVELAKTARIVLIMAGLPETYESEGFDRQHLDMPKSHNELISRISEVNKNVVVILSAGSPVTMPWMDSVNALLHTYLSGQAGSEAIMDVLFGDVNPSGKLAETYPRDIKDTPCYGNFAQPGRNALYKESIFIGYRYYDTFNVDVLFPFGFGLSYTTFGYRDLNIEGEFPDLTVSFVVENTGSVSGGEIAQLYIHHKNPSIFKAKRALKGFEKVHLQPSESKIVTIRLDSRSFSYFNTDINDWVIENGDYEIQIGESITHIHLRESVLYDKNTISTPVKSLPEFVPDYYNRNHPISISDGNFTQLTGITIPFAFRRKDEPFTINSTITELADVWIGRLLATLALRQSKKLMPSTDEKIMKMIERGVMESPLRSLIAMSNGTMTLGMVQWILKIANIGKKNTR